MLIIGLMSGTSVDGIDVALVEITPSEHQEDLKKEVSVGEDSSPPLTAFLGHQSLKKSSMNHYIALKLREFKTYCWSKEDSELIFDLLHNPQNHSVSSICEANFKLGKGFAMAIENFLKDIEPKFNRSEISLISSHGQTIWHNVDPENGNVTSTLQIGESSVITEQTGITTIHDFRVADVAAGGQGAPLVSVFDNYFLKSERGWRAVVNIGGIANVTILPPKNAKEKDVKILAFDTGPGNALIDWVVSELTGGKMKMDIDGKLAKSSKPYENLLDEIISNVPYFKRKPPKTTGRELFSQSFAVNMLNKLKKHFEGEEKKEIFISRVVATFTELTVSTLTEAILKFSVHPVSEVIVGGGGSKNPTIMRRIQQRMGNNVSVSSCESIGVNSDAKEAVAFAFLGYLCYKGIFGNVPSCTAAAGPRILGKITPAYNNYVKFDVL